jgi:hypothetical protein
MSSGAGRISRSFLGHRFWNPPKDSTPIWTFKKTEEVDAQLPTGDLVLVPGRDWHADLSFSPLNAEFYKGHPKADELAWLYRAK